MMILDLKKSLRLLPVSVCRFSSDNKDNKGIKAMCLIKSDVMGTTLTSSMAYLYLLSKYYHIN